MQSSANHVAKNLVENLDAVDRLARFDDEVLQYLLHSLELLDERLSAQREKLRHRATVTIEQIRNIKNNESLRPRYSELLNQCVVLQVSYLSSAMSDLLRACIPRCIERGHPESLLAQELKLSVSQVLRAEARAGRSPHPKGRVHLSGHEEHGHRVQDLARPRPAWHRRSRRK